MAVTVRFRPVVFGRPERPSGTAYLIEEESGRVFFRDPDFPWELRIPLSAVTVRDLPGPYQRKDALLIILPVQEVTGADLIEVSRRIDDVLDRLQTEGVGQRMLPQRRPRASAH